MVHQLIERIKGKIEFKVLDKGGILVIISLKK